MFQILVYLLSKNCNPPEKSHPLFPSNPPLKSEVLSSPPLFENLVGGSTPSSRKGVVHTMVCIMNIQDFLYWGDGEWKRESPPPPAENLFMPATPRKIPPQVDSPHHQHIFIPPKVDSPPPCQTISLLGAWGDGRGSPLPTTRKIPPSSRLPTTTKFASPYQRLIPHHHQICISLPKVNFPLPH